MSEHVLPSGMVLPRIEVPKFKGWKGLPQLLDRVERLLRRDSLTLMAGFSDATEVLILDSVFGDGATNLYTAPTHLALLTSAAGESDTGSTIVEASYTGYARKTLAAADLSAAAAGAKTNSAVQTFAACTAGTSTIIGWAVTNNITTGAVVCFGTCTSTVISTTQTPATVAIGALGMTLD